MAHYNGSHFLTMRTHKKTFGYTKPKSMKSTAKLSNCLVILIISFMCLQPNIFHLALTTILSYSCSERKMKKLETFYQKHSSLKQNINKKNHKSKTKSLVSPVWKLIFILSCCILVNFLHSIISDDKSIAKDTL